MENSPRSGECAVYGRNHEDGDCKMCHKSPTCDYFNRPSYNKLKTENEALCTQRNELIRSEIKALEEIEALKAEVGQFQDDISYAIKTTRFLDQTDGGDVPLCEQVNRMRQELEKAEAERDRLREVFDAAVALCTNEKLPGYKVFTLNSNLKQAVDGYKALNHKEG